MRAVCTTILLLLTWTATAQETTKWATVGNWDILIDPALGNGCFATKVYDDGSALRLGFEGNSGIAYLVLYNSSWQSLEQGEEYELDIEFDNEGKWNAPATVYAMGGNLNALMVTTSEPEFLTEFMERWNIKIFYQGREILRLPLSGSHKAVQEMVTCQDAVMQAGRSQDPDSNDPFASEPSGDPFHDRDIPNKDKIEDPFVMRSERQSVSIGGNTVSVGLPKHFCEISESNPDGKRLLELARTGMAQGELFGAYAPCDTLQRWYRGELLVIDRYSAVATLEEFVMYEVPIERAEFIGSISDAYDATSVNEAADKAVQYFNKQQQDVAMSDMTMLGILEETDDAIFVGAVSSLRTEFGDWKDMVAIVAVTVLSNRAVYLNHYRDFESKTDLDNALEFSKDWVRRAVRTN